MYIDIASSKTCSWQFRCPSCRFLSGYGRLVVLGEAATVDPVFDMIIWATCFRPVLENVSQSFMPLPVGEASARRPGRCCTHPLQMLTSSLTLLNRRHVPGTVSLSFVRLIGDRGIKACHPTAYLIRWPWSPSWLIWRRSAIPATPGLLVSFAFNIRD